MTGRLPALIAVAVALSHCSKPTSPPGPAPPGAAEYRTLAAWLARQGIPAPAEGPPAREAASGARLLGDATGDGAAKPLAPVRVREARPGDRPPGGKTGAARLGAKGGAEKGAPALARTPLQRDGVQANRDREPPETAAP